MSAYDGNFRFQNKAKQAENQWRVPRVGKRRDGFVRVFTGIGKHMLIVRKVRGQKALPFGAERSIPSHLLRGRSYFD
jgi:hypothetical protein